MTQYQIKPTSTYGQLLKTGWKLRGNGANYANTTATLTLLRRGYFLTSPDGLFSLRPVRSNITDQLFRIELRQVEAGNIGEYKLTEGGVQHAIDQMNL